MSNVQNSK
jgi:hypothetical protein